MNKLTRNDLMPLETYAEQRENFRADVLMHKRHRLFQLGKHTTLIFEDRKTVQYQIQEMLRVEKIFEVAGIEEELAAYNPLIPDSNNLKATFLIEYEDVTERQQALSQLLGIEDKIWLQVENFEKVWAIADEDLERANDVKTSAVHFLRFEFTDTMIAAARSGVAISAGIDHTNYQAEYTLTTAIQNALVADFD